MKVIMFLLLMFNATVVVANPAYDRNTRIIKAEQFVINWADEASKGRRGNIKDYKSVCNWLKQNYMDYCFATPSLRRWTTK